MNEKGMKRSKEERKKGKGFFLEGCDLVFGIGVWGSERFEVRLGFVWIVVGK